MRGATLLPRWLRVAAVVGVALLALPILGLLTAVDGAALVPTLTSPSALIALRLSLVTALAATALSLLVGLPVALLMARSDPGSVRCGSCAPWCCCRWCCRRWSAASPCCPPTGDAGS